MEETKLTSSHKNGYSYDDVMSICGVTRPTVMNWKKVGYFETYKSPIDKHSIMITSKSLIDFLTRGRNKKYFDHACKKSNLFHDGDFNRLINCMQISDVTIVEKPEVEEKPNDTDNDNYKPTYDNTYIKILRGHIKDLESDINRTDDSIAAFISLKNTYQKAKSNLKLTRSGTNAKEIDVEIRKLDSAIRGVDITIDLLKNIKRTYTANISVIKLTINVDEKISV